MRRIEDDFTRLVQQVEAIGPFESLLQQLLEAAGRSCAPSIRTKRLAHRAVCGPSTLSTPQIQWAPEVIAPLLGLPWPIELDPFGFDWGTWRRELYLRIRAEERMARLVFAPGPFNVINVGP